MTLFNGSMYCAHRIGDRPLIDYTRFITPIEIGWNTFNYRIGYAEEGLEETMAMEFNQKQFALVFFPHGNGRERKERWSLPKSVTLTCFRKVKSGKEVRLFNNSDKKVSFNGLIDGVSVDISIDAYQVKTFLVKDGKVEEVALAIDVNR
jgi:hypothetical protein